MKFDKTRYWTFGLPRRDGSEAPEPAAPRSSTRIFQTADLIAPTPVSTLAPKPLVGASTRIMPIEHLLAPVPRAPSQDSQSAQTLRPDSAKRLLRELSSGARLKLRGTVALMALAGSAVFAYFSFVEHSEVVTPPMPRARQHDQPAPPDAPSEPPLVKARSSPAESVTASPAQTTAEPRAAPGMAAPVRRAQFGSRSARGVHEGGALTPARAAQQRSAADAVARGDFAGAVRAYEVLARSQPGHLVYVEAARILRARLAARAEPSQRALPPRVELRQP